MNKALRSILDLNVKPEFVGVEGLAEEVDVLAAGEELLDTERGLAICIEHRDQWRSASTSRFRIGHGCAGVERSRAELLVRLAVWYGYRCNDGALRDR